MKVQDFFQSLENKDQILKKIKDFKRRLAVEASKKAMSTCAACGGSLLADHEKLVGGRYVREIVHCLYCKGRSAQRYFSLN